MTTPAAQQAAGPEPGGEAQPAAGLTGEQAHALREPEPVHERVEPEPGEPEPREPEPGEPGERQPEPPPALAMPDLRPYADPKALLNVTRHGLRASRRPARSLARRAATTAASGIRHTLAGTADLLRLLGSWLTGEVGKNGSRMARFGGVAAGLLAIAHTLAEYPTEGVTALMSGWLLVGLAHRTGVLDKLDTRAKSEKPKGSGAAAVKPAEEAPAKTINDAPKPSRKGLAGWLRRAPAEEPAETPPEAPTEPPLTALLRDLIGDDNGIHLAVLRPAMRAHFPHLANATDQQLRKVLVDAGFDPSRTFRAGGRAGLAGIHRDQLPPLPSPRTGPGTGKNSSPPPESGSDQGISPPALRHSPGVKRSGERRRTLPKGWTAKEVERGWRIVDDPDAGPTAARIERLEDAG